MESKLQRLSINQDPSKTKHTASKDIKGQVADSWDDEAGSSNSDTELDNTTPLTKSPVPSAPPPTPASPKSAFQSWDTQSSTPFNIPIGDRDDGDRRRPEKSTAAAERLIAAGLGVRAPKKTEEQKAYDRASRENEMRRRIKEKEAREKAREEEEKAKAAMWES